MEFINSLEPLLQTFWYVALPASLVFIIQSIMTFMGADATDGIDADFDGDFDGADAPFQLFSLRNMINFLLGFSWTGISLYESFENKTILIFVAVVVGIAFVIVFFLIIKQMMKLSENNAFVINDALGKTADVYLTIPGKRSGKGKILISVKGSIHELDAITDSETIESSSVVKVKAIESDTLLLVDKI